MPSTNVFDATNYTAVLSEVPQVWHDGSGTISYTLLTAFPGYYSNGRGGYVVDGVTYAAGTDPDLNAAQARLAQLAIRRYNEVAELNLVASTSGVGDVTFGALDLGDPTLFGFAYLPDGAGVAGDVWLNTGMELVLNPQNYDEGWATIIHELGHALGLEHPFDGILLPEILDTNQYSVMSYLPVPDQWYRSDAARQWPSTPMLYDIQALQAEYGPNLSTRTGNDTYFAQNGVSGFAIGDGGALIATIWDAGGIDTFSGVHQSDPVRIDLRPGRFSTIGSISENVAIALAAAGTRAQSAWIENAVGGSANDYLYGNERNNVLDGRAGSDTAHGFAGDDTYIVAEAGDRVYENAGAGRDTVKARTSFVLTSGSEIEVLATAAPGSSVALDLTGNGYAQRITGSSGNNVINGRGGADTMIGGLRNDTYVVDTAGDQIIELRGEGADTVLAAVSYTLAAGVSVETMMTANIASRSAIRLTGNEFSQRLSGNAGDNRLDGRGGRDTMTGHDGDDTYVVDNAADLIVEAAGAGRDTVQTSVSYSLRAGVSVEVLTADDTAALTALRLTGNAFRQTIIGNDGDNTLNGGDGSDVLRGNAGGDTFVFSTALSTANIDRIVDFTAGDDVIALDNAVFAALGSAGALDNAAFALGANAADASDRVLYDAATGVLAYDRDGTGSAARQTVAILSAGLAIGAGDFLIV